MHDHLLYTRSPVAATDRLPVLVYVDVDGTGSRQPMSIERDVSWIAECEARVLFSHGGRTLKDGATLGDHTYGFGSCLGSAVEDARRMCAIYAVTSESSLEVSVQAVVSLTAVLPIPVSEERGIRSYREIPDDWIADREGAVEAFREFWSGKHEVEVPPLVRHLKGDLIPAETVWSSTRSEEENAALMASFREKAGIAS